MDQEIKALYDGYYKTVDYSKGLKKKPNPILLDKVLECIQSCTTFTNTHNVPVGGAVSPVTLTDFVEGARDNPGDNGNSVKKIMDRLKEFTKSHFDRIKQWRAAH